MHSSAFKILPFSNFHLIILGIFFISCHHPSLAFYEPPSFTQELEESLQSQFPSTIPVPARLARGKPNTYKNQTCSEFSEEDDCFSRKTFLKCGDGTCQCSSTNVYDPETDSCLIRTGIGCFKDRGDLSSPDVQKCVSNAACVGHPKDSTGVCNCLNSPNIQHDDFNRLCNISPAYASSAISQTFQGFYRSFLVKQLTPLFLSFFIAVLNE